MHNSQSRAGICMLGGWEWFGWWQRSSRLVSEVEDGFVSRVTVATPELTEACPRKRPQSVPNFRHRPLVDRPLNVE